MRRLPLLALLAAACNSGFDPQYRVVDLRILAARSEVVGSGSADAAPGDTLRLEALVANPLRRAPLSVRWFVCAPSAPDEIAACRDPELLRDPDALALQPGVVEVAQGEAVTVALPDVAEALNRAIELASRSPTFQCRLYVEVLVVVVAEAEDQRDVAVKEVRLVPLPGSLPTGVESHYTVNFNPAIGEVVRDPLDADRCAGGSPLAPDPFPAGQTVLCGRPAPGAAGPYNECDPSGAPSPVLEFLFWQWYVTDGEFPEFDGIGNAVGESVDFGRPQGAFTIWVILRDGRGGVDWVRRDVVALP